MNSQSIPWKKAFFLFTLLYMRFCLSKHFSIKSIDLLCIYEALNVWLIMKFNIQRFWWTNFTTKKSPIERELFYIDQNISFQRNKGFVKKVISFGEVGTSVSIMREVVLITINLGSYIDSL